MGAGEAEIKGTIVDQAVRPGEHVLDAKVTPVIESLDQALRRVIPQIVRSEQAKHPPTFLEGLYSELDRVIQRVKEPDKQTKLFNWKEIFKGRTNRRDRACQMMVGYLGEYDAGTCTFVTGGVEAVAQATLDENQEVIQTLRKQGKIGYNDFWHSVERLILLSAGLEKADKEFSQVNRQKGKSLIVLDELNTKDKRVKWIAETFGVDKKNVEKLWNEARAAKEAAAAGDAVGRDRWQKFTQSWKSVGITDQVAILGLLQITQSQDIDNFLTDGSVKDGSGNELSAISLGGGLLRRVGDQYIEVVTGFIDSNSDGDEHLRIGPTGLQLRNLSLRDRALIRVTTDYTALEAGDDGGMVNYLIERTRARTRDGRNVWNELVARAELETAYYERFRGQVNVIERFTQARYDRAAFDEVASAEIIHDHWFGRITGFRQAVARYTSGSGEYDRLYADAANDGERRILERADRYARLFLEMCGAPIGGLSKDKQRNLQQIFDSTVSSRSGPVSERFGVGPQAFMDRGVLEDAVLGNRYIRSVRLNESTNQQEIILKIIGFDGEFIIPMVDASTLGMVNGGGGRLFNYLMDNGQYKEAGYWPEWEATVGSGFNAYAKDGVEHCFGLLAQNNLPMYQKREIGRRLNELYNGSQRHKRVFIQFLLERREVLGGNGWRTSFQSEQGVVFDPHNDRHLQIIADKLGIRPGDTGELINELANPQRWGLFFNSTTQAHVDRILSSKKDMGFDGLYKNLLWGFEAMTFLREHSNVLVNMFVHGVHYKNGIWTGLTVEKLDEFVGKWKHCKPWEALEVQATLAESVNKAQTEEIMRLIGTPKHPITHEQLDHLFTHRLWDVALLDAEEKEEVASAARDGREIRVLREVVSPLTAEEAARGETILGKAMRVKAGRMQLNIRASLDQALFWDLVSQPGLSLGTIYQKLIDQHMFEYCLPLLSRGDIERINDNPAIYPMLPLNDPDSYRLISGRGIDGDYENMDPRYARMVDYILGALYVSSTISMVDEFRLKGINARDVAYNEHSAAGNQGLGLNKVKELLGINNVLPIDRQLSRHYQSLANVNWSELDREYAYLPDVVIRFAREYYGVDITSVEEVERVGGDAFLDQFKEIIRDRNRLMFIMFGVNMAEPRLLPAKYERYYKDVIGGLMGQHRLMTEEIGEEEIIGPSWFAPIPVISANSEYEAITYDTVIRHMHDKWLREPVYGPWPHVPMPHIQVDREAVMAAAFIDPERPVGDQMAEIVDYMIELSNPPGGEVSHTLETQFYPQIERYALNYMRQITVDGDTVVLSPLNIKKYMPKVIEEFRTKLTQPGVNNRRGYNIAFMNEYLIEMFGVDSGGVDDLRDVDGLKNELKTLFNEIDFPKYITLLSGRVESLRKENDKTPLSPEKKILALYYLYELRDKLEFGVEGPSILYQLIKVAMDRNYGYFKDKIIEMRTESLPPTSNEREGIRKTLEGLKDFETSKLGVAEQKAYVAEQVGKLRSFGLNESQMALFIGAIQLYDISDLETLLDSDDPSELAPYFGERSGISRKVSKFAIWATTILSNTPFLGHFAKEFKFESHTEEFIRKEQENIAWNASSYFPLPSIGTLFAIFPIEGAQKWARKIGKSPFTPKAGSIPLLIEMSAGLQIGAAVLRAFTATNLESGLATIIQAIGRTPANLLNFDYPILGVGVTLGALYYLAGFIHDFFLVPEYRKVRQREGKRPPTKTQYFDHNYPDK